MTEAGYLILFDVSGYTEFLLHSGLEEGTGILESLLGTLLKHVEPPLRVVEIEGDAVFAYAPSGAFRRGQTFLEVLESLYCVFAATRDQMQHNETCGCSGCQLIPRLDAKIVAHFGDFALSNMAPGRSPRPSGPAVILAHRLLKNRVTEETGIRSYAFMTQACIDALDLGWLSERATQHQETYEHIGVVRGYVHDLAPVWASDRASRLSDVEMDRTWVEVTAELEASSQEIWDAITTPAFRSLWSHANRAEVAAGRVGSGTEYRCYRGEVVRIDTVVDWQPFRRLALDCEWRWATHVRMTVELKATGRGTAVVARLGRPQVEKGLVGGLARLLWGVRRKQIERQARASLEWLRGACRSDRRLSAPAHP